MGALPKRGLALVLLLTACGRSEFEALRENPEPDLVPFTASSISAGVYHTLVVRDNVIYGSGSNAFGQLAGAPGGSTFTRIDDSRTWAVVKAGDSHSCALDTTGVVFCWGDNIKGQLGVGDFNPRATPTAVALPGVVRELDARHETSCAILTDDQLYCWGYNEENGLGLPVLFENQASPVKIDPVAGTGYRTVGVGQGHLCAIPTTGELYCSGRNTEHQVSRSDNIQLGVLTLVDNGTDWWSVNATIATTCALRGGTAGIAGELWCMGVNDAGQLGQDDFATYSAPVRVGGTRSFAKVATGVLHTCAIDAADVLTCWGRNLEGQLGIGEPSADSPAVNDIAGGMRQLSIGRLDTVVLNSRGELLGAGSNESGQLGLGDGINRSTFTPVLVP